MSTRPSFEQIYMRLAFMMAERSTCERVMSDGSPAQVGCVITSTDFRYVYGVGYNGSAAGGPNGCDKHGAEAVGNCGCFVEGTLVSAIGVRKAFRRKYIGDLLRIRTTTSQFSVTPNHPILVRGRGWVSAQALQKGDKLLKTGAPQRDTTTELKHYDRIPIEQVFESTRFLGSLRVRCANAVDDFHGDGLVDQHVDVVTTDTRLRPDSEVVAFKKAANSDLVFADHAETLFARSCAENQAFRIADQFGSIFRRQLAVHRTQSRGPSSRNHASINKPSTDDVRSHTKLDSECFLSLASDVAIDNARRQIEHSLSFVPVEILGHLAQNASLTEPFLNSRMRDVVSRSDLENSFSALVSPDDVVDIERYAWSGHVFNLETESNWYTVEDGIIAHNCVHAETNAIVNCRADRSLRKVVLVTHLPCVPCSKLLVNLGGVEKVYFRKDYRIRDGLLWLSRAGIAVGHLTEDRTAQEAFDVADKLIGDLMRDQKP